MFFFVCFSFNLQKVKKKKKRENTNSTSQCKCEGTTGSLWAGRNEKEAETKREAEGKVKREHVPRQPYKIKQKKQFLWKNISFKKLCWQKRENTVCPERARPWGGGMEGCFGTFRSGSRLLASMTSAMMSERGAGEDGIEGKTNDGWEIRNQRFGYLSLFPFSCIFLGFSSWDVFFSCKNCNMKTTRKKIKISNTEFIQLFLGTWWFAFRL